MFYVPQDSMERGILKNFGNETRPLCVLYYKCLDFSTYMNFVLVYRENVAKSM